MSEAIGSVESAARVSAADLARRYLDSSDLDGAWFALGGSSLDAARLVSALDQELGVTLSLRDLLCATSVHDCVVAAEQHAQVSTTVATAATSTPDVAAVPASPPDDVAAVPADPPEVPITATAGAASTAADLLWPALAALPPDERLKLAHSLLSSVVERDGALPTRPPSA